MGGTSVEGARKAPVKLGKFAQDVQAKKEAEIEARWRAIRAAERREN